MKDFEATVEATGSWNALDSRPDFPSTLPREDFVHENSGNPPLPPRQAENVPPVIPTDTDKMQNLLQAAVEIHQTLMLMNSSPTQCPHDQLLRTQQQLHEIDEHISSMLPQPVSTGTVVPANDVQGPDASNRSKQLFKCRDPDCGDKMIVLSKVTIKRHVNDVHYPKSTWHCDVSECGVVARRRHRMKEHFNTKHECHPTKEELDELKTDHECPPICPLCGCQVKNWSEFYRCFISHCIIGGPTPSNACSSRRLSLQSNEETDDDSDDDQDPPTPAVEGPCPAQWQNGVRNPMQPLLPSSYANPSQLMGSQPALPNRPLGPQPVPNNQSREMAPPPHPRVNNSRVQGNGTHPTSGAGRRRNPQRPRTPRDVTPHRRNRIERHTHRVHNWLRCGICRHSFGSCHLCFRRRNSAGGCHVCQPRLGIVTNNQAPSQRDTPGPTTATRRFNLEGAAQNLLGRRDLVFDPNAPYVPGQRLGWDPQGYYYSQGNLFNDIDQVMTDTTGNFWTSSRRNNPQLRAVLSVDVAVLTEREMENSSMLDLKAPRPLSILSSLLPLIDPFKKWFFTPLKGLSRMALSGMSPLSSLSVFSLFANETRNINVCNWQMLILYRTRSHHRGRGSPACNHQLGF